MAKGRKTVPCKLQDGSWFRHRGLGREETDMQRAAATSTGSMLVAPFLPDNTARPEPPPQPFMHKNDVNYKKSNRFSDHDNRNHFQDHGVYFGDGHTTRLLGRRLLSSDRRLHHTDTDFLDHHTMRPVRVDRNSLYSASYLGGPTKEPPVHRRFAKNYESPKSGMIPLDTSTSNWHERPPKPYRTPLHVLAVSQEPFLPNNPWKYSNNSLKRVYPPYDRKSDPVIDNTFNRYGAAFLTGSASAKTR